MKISTCLLMVGGVVAVGVSVYLAYQKKHTENTGGTGSVDIGASEPSAVIQPGVQSEVHKPSIDEVKVEVATSVIERHIVASEAVRESVESILADDDSEAVVTENTEKLHKIGEDLDEILK